jgi:hypothetical protein
MSGFRLHIDIPLPMSEEDAMRTSDFVLGFLTNNHPLQDGLRSRGVPQINYRLGHDEDRQRSNYLHKTPSGHVTNKKCRILIQLEIPNEQTSEEII